MPNSPPEEGQPSTSKKQVYYRPSVERAIAHLRAKVGHLAAPERYEQFDHLVRALNKDGLWAEAGREAPPVHLVEGKLHVRVVLPQHRAESTRMSPR